MATSSIDTRPSFVVGGIPKPWFPIALSAGLWAALFALGHEGLQVLSALTL